jgi:hypothetical protein
MEIIIIEVGAPNLYTPRLAQILANSGHKIYTVNTATMKYYSSDDSAYDVDKQLLLLNSADQGDCYIFNFSFDSNSSFSEYQKDCLLLFMEALFVTKKITYATCPKECELHKFIKRVLALPGNDDVLIKAKNVNELAIKIATLLEKQQTVS